MIKGYMRHRRICKAIGLKPFRFSEWKRRNKNEEIRIDR